MVPVYMCQSFNRSITRYWNTCMQMYYRQHTNMAAVKHTRTHNSYAPESLALMNTLASLSELNFLNLAPQYLSTWALHSSQVVKKAHGRHINTPLWFYSPCPVYTWLSTNTCSIVWHHVVRFFCLQSRYTRGSPALTYSPHTSGKSHSKENSNFNYWWRHLYVIIGLNSPWSR